MKEKKQTTNKKDFKKLKAELSSKQTLQTISDYLALWEYHKFDSYEEALEQVTNYAQKIFRWGGNKFFVLNEIHNNYFFQSIEIETKSSGKGENLTVTYEINVEDIAIFQGIKKVKLNIHSWENTKEILAEYNLAIKNNNTSTIIDLNQIKKGNQKLNQVLKEACPIKKNYNITTFAAFKHFIDELKSESKDVILVSGYYNGKYCDVNNIKNIYTEKRENHDGSMERLWKSVNHTKEYLDFMSMNFDPVKVSECLYAINNELPRISETGFDERYYLKMMIAWSISSIVKFEMLKHGVDCFPIMYLVGKKNTGKSSRAHILFSKMWNSSAREKDNLDGRAGARLTDLNYDTFPLFFDEVTELKQQSNLKSGTYNGLIKFSKGMKNGGHYDIKIFKPWAICANGLLIKDDALLERITILNYDDFNMNNNSGDCLEKLKHDVIHLGKYIYSKLGDYNYKELLDKYGDKHSKDYSGRDLTKIQFYKVGEHICNDLGIFEDIELPCDLLAFSKADLVIDRWETIRHIINELIDETKIRKGMEEVTVKEIMHEGRITLDVFNKMANKGIYFSKSFDAVLLNKNILTRLNRKLKQEGMSILKYLSQLGKEYDFLKYTNHKYATPELEHESTFGIYRQEKKFPECMTGIKWEYMYN